MIGALRITLGLLIFFGLLVSVFRFGRQQGWW